MHTSEARVPADHSEKPAEGADPQDVSKAANRLRAEFNATCAALRRAFYIETQALRLKLFDSALWAGAFLGLGLMGVTIAVSAVIFAMLALRRGMALLAHDAWWSDLVLAAAALALVLLAGMFTRRMVHRSTLLNTRRRLEHKHPISAPAPSTENAR